MLDAPRITIELYGVPRIRAGRRLVLLQAGTIGALIAELRIACPELEPVVIRGDAIHPAYRLWKDDMPIRADDPALPLAEGDVLMLVAADAGG